MAHFYFVNVMLNYFGVCFIGEWWRISRLHAYSATPLFTGSAFIDYSLAPAPSHLSFLSWQQLQCCFSIGFNNESSDGALLFCECDVELFFLAATILRHL
jgi:hypothetical protein